MTYNSQFTVDLSVTGTSTNHWGQEEHTIVLSGAGNFNAELNNQKNYLIVAPSITGLLTGENYEASIDNSGTVGVWHGYTSQISNDSTGIMTNGGVGYYTSFTNYNTAGGAVFQYIGYFCNPANGSGSSFIDYCFFNADPKGSIANEGHFSARPDTNVPTLNSNCGTGAALSARSSDDAGQLTVGTGTPTSCSINFFISYGISPATVIVVASDGGTAPTYTYSASSINFTSVRSGGVYQYWVIGSN